MSGAECVGLVDRQLVSAKVKFTAISRKPNAVRPQSAGRGAARVKNATLNWLLPSGNPLVHRQLQVITIFFKLNDIKQLGKYFF